MITANMIANDIKRIYTSPVTENNIAYNKGDLVIDAEVANKLFSVSPTMYQYLQNLQTKNIVIRSLKIQQPT